MLVATSIPNPPVPAELARFDKVAHFAMYALLAALLVWARPAGRRTTVLAVIAILVAVAAYGALDEWHQQFIPGRSMDLSDWLADTSGAIVGAVAATLGARARTPLTR